MSARATDMAASPTGVVRVFFEIGFEAGDLDAAVRMMAEDFVDHAPWHGHPGTREGFRAGAVEMRAAFPDFSIQPTKMLEEDDKVAVFSRIRGTHLGEFIGHPPTGRTFEIEAIDILRVENGQLREHWGVLEVDQMFAQLRLAPPS